MKKSKTRLSPYTDVVSFRVSKLLKKEMDRRDAPVKRICNQALQNWLEQAEKTKEKRVA